MFNAALLYINCFLIPKTLKVYWTWKHFIMSSYEDNNTGRDNTGREVQTANVHLMDGLCLTPMTVSKSQSDQPNKFLERHSSQDVSAGWDSGDQLLIDLSQ